MGINMENFAAHNAAQWYDLGAGTQCGSVGVVSRGCRSGSRHAAGVGGTEVV